MPNTPCFDDNEYNASENQQFYFGELARNHRTCSKEGLRFNQMSTPVGSGLEKLTEYDFQKENGILDALDELLHITYSIWPSTKAVKSQVFLNLYQ